ncbi:MAG: hypothetical protein OHK0038_14950 [Flammeovirgaceae bacterium]
MISDRKSISYMKKIPLLFILSLLLSENSNAQNPNYVPVEQNKKWGVQKTSTKEMIVPYQYDEVTEFYGGIAGARNGKFFAIMDTTGKLLSPFQYTWVEISDYDLCDEAEESLIRIAKGNKNGIWLKNKEIVPCEFDIIEECGAEFYRNFRLIVVIKGNKEGIYDAKGNQLIEPKYDDITASWEDGVKLLYSRKGRLYGVIDSLGNIVTEPKYSHLPDVLEEDNRFLTVKAKGKWGMIDAKGKEILPTEYDLIDGYTSQQHRYVFVVKEGRVGVYDIQTQKEFVPCQFMDYDEIMTKYPDKWKEVIK